MTDYRQNHPQTLVVPHFIGANPPSTNPRQMLRPLFHDEEAIRLLAVAAGVPEGELPDQATDIVTECGRLPLALALCGALVRRGMGWERVLEQLRQARIHRIADRHAVEPQTGDPPEPTCLALLFSLQGAKASSAPPQPPIHEFLARGSPWESLGLWGNALLCHLIGQSLYPDDLDLKLRAGRAQLRQPNLVAAAYRPLLEVAESRPCAAEAAAALAECCLRVADNPRAEVRGSTRDELREWALMDLERAAALAPDDSTIRESRDLLRGRLGANPFLDFFSVE